MFTVTLTQGKPSLRSRDLCAAAAVMVCSARHEAGRHVLTTVARPRGQHTAVRCGTAEHSKTVSQNFRLKFLG